MSKNISDEAALSEFNRAVKADPANLSYRQARSMVLYRLGKYEDAIDDFSSVLKESPDNIHMLSRRSFCYMTVGRYKDGIQDCTRVIAVDQREGGSALRNRALAYDKLGMHQLAEKDRLEMKRLGLAPGVVEGLDEADALMDQNKFSKALEVNTRILALSPKCALVLHQRGQLHLRLEEPKKAIEDQNICLRIDPKFVNAYVERAEARLYADNDMDGALDDVNRAVGLCKMPDHFGPIWLWSMDANPLERALYIRSRLCGVLGHSDKQLADLTLLIRKHPQPWSEYFVSRAVIYADKREYATALKDCASAVAADPTNLRARRVRGIIYSNMKQYDKAIAEFDAVIKENPLDDQMYSQRGRAYLRARKFELACKDFTQAIKIAGEQDASHYYKWRALTYFSMGNKKLAKQDVLQVKRLSKLPAKPKRWLTKNQEPDFVSRFLGGY